MNKVESSKSKRYTTEEVLEELLYFTGIITLFFGFSGIVMMIFYPNLYEDKVLSTGMTFIDSYMTIIGIFLILYHSKIIVKPVRT